MKLAKYTLYFLLIATAIITILFYVNGKSSTMVSLMLNWAYILIFICVVLAVLLPILFSNGKGFKGTLIMIGAFLVVGVLSYLFASGDPVQVATTEQATHNELKITDTLIIATGILLTLGILSIVFGGIISLIRKR